MKEEKEKKEETVKGKNEKVQQEGKPQPDKQLKELQEKLTAAIKEKDEIFVRLQRVSADYDNFQKRAHRQTSETVCFEREKLIKSLLPLIDDLERTIKNAYSASAEEAVIVKGVKLVYDNILHILKACGVEQIQAVGEKFNPFFHEAISLANADNKEDNIILEESQKGYKVESRVIRPSKVIVNKLSKAEAVKEKKAESAETQQDDHAETTDIEE